MAVSAFASTTYEEVTKTAPDALKWAQMYVYKDKSITLDFVRRVENAGYKAIVITIDTLTTSMNSSDFRNKLILPENVRPFNYDAYTEGQDTHYEWDSLTKLIHPSLCWDDIKWLKSVTKLPVIVKGVLAPADATQAANYGVDGILVSNKGGRQLDGLPTTVSTITGLSTSPSISLHHTNEYDIKCEEAQ